MEDESIRIRLSILEEQRKVSSKENQQIMKELKMLNDKLDTVIKDKADKEELKELNFKMWGFVTLIITAFVGLLVYLIQGSME